MSKKPPMYPDKELTRIYEEMAIGSRIYKTILDQKDYENMMKKISKTEVQPFKKETLQ